jgi:hypothetical protein
MNDLSSRSQSARPGLGHNNPPEPVSPLETLDLRLSKTYRELVVRFIELGIGCTRVPQLLESSEQAAIATDFIAQCQAHIRTAEAAHKAEKEFFLKGGRIVDGFFKRRCEKLAAALEPVGKSLGTYHDGLAADEARRCEEDRQAAESAALVAEEEEAQLRKDANRLLSEGDDRGAAAETLRLADLAAARAATARMPGQGTQQPLHIRGDYGSTAYVRKTWTFEVIDLNRVPREYMSLDVEVVRDAIVKDGVRDIPGLRIYQSETLRVRGAA